MKFTRNYGILLAFLIVIGTLVRLIDVENYFFSPDDIFHIAIANTDSINEVLLRNSTDIHPPLIYILLHLLIKLGFEGDYLRLISLVPGIMIIPASYLLGKVWFSRAVGLVLSLVSTFSYGLILNSQTIRQYSLSMLFIILAFCAYKKLIIEFNSRNTIVYLLLFLFSVITHYLMLIPILALSAIVFYRNTKNRSVQYLFLGGHILLGIILFIFYLYHGNQQWFTSSPQIKAARTEWLTFGFHDSFLSIISSFIQIVSYFTTPMFISTYSSIISSLIIIFFIYSVYISVRKFQSTVFAIFIITFGLNIGLSLLGFYPFSGTRHSLHLYPVFLIVVGQAIDVLASHFKNTIAEFIRNKTKIYSLLFIIIFLSTLWVKYHNYYRDYYFGYWEFPLTQEEVSLFTQYIFKNINQDTMIITDKQTGLLLSYLENNNSDNLIFDEVVLTDYLTVPVVYKNVWGVELDEDDFNDLLPLNNRPKEILLISAGWTQNGFGKFIEKIIAQEYTTLKPVDTYVWDEFTNDTLVVRFGDIK